jgi:uncharacterized protein (DUF2235 family)
MSKNIVVCCDGTGQQFGQANTNVVHTYALTRQIPGRQHAYYDPGVGTGGWGKGALEKNIEKVTGDGLQRNVNDAYRILMETFEEGDAVFLFGFSRGAFTVRSLSGMLAKVGLLRRNHENLLDYAVEQYHASDNAAVAAEFKATFSRPCPVHFLAVWDTVKSVMETGERDFQAVLTDETAHAFHALAIDEQRAAFQPSLWSPSATSNTHSEQVWFPGVHSDVGGGYAERGLANISLRWMLKKAVDAGLDVDEARLEEDRFQPDPAGELHHEAYSGGWRLLGSEARAITADDRVHEAAFQRMNDDAVDYAPDNWPEDEPKRVAEML